MFSQSNIWRMNCILCKDRLRVRQLEALVFLSSRLGNELLSKRNYLKLNVKIKIISCYKPKRTGLLMVAPQKISVVPDMTNPAIIGNSCRFASSPWTILPCGSVIFLICLIQSDYSKYHIFVLSSTPTIWLNKGQRTDEMSIPGFGRRSHVQEQTVGLRFFPNPSFITSYVSGIGQVLSSTQGNDDLIKVASTGLVRNKLSMCLKCHKKYELPETTRKKSVFWYQTGL